MKGDGGARSELLVPENPAFTPPSLLPPPYHRQLAPRRKADRTLAGLLLRPPDAPAASTFSALAKTLGWGTGDVAAAKRQALAPLSPNVAGISDVGSDMFGSSGSGKPASPAPGNPSPPTPHAPALLTPSRIRRGPPPRLLGRGSRRSRDAPGEGTPTP